MNSYKTGTISVIMPNYNTPLSILAEAVSSILSQSFKDFEFIIIDDCSTNGSYEYLSLLDDDRIKLIRNESNLGITKSLNIGMNLASGKYIARMDSDDISEASRLEKQVAFMEDNPDVIVCGSWIEAFGDKKYKQKRQISDNEAFRCSLLFGNTYGLPHPTALFRKDTIEKNAIRYDEDLDCSQDYGMWVSCSDVGRIAFVEEYLLKYRVHSGQISTYKREKQEECRRKVQKKILSRVFTDPQKIDIDLHSEYCNTKQVLPEHIVWLNTIIRENHTSRYYDEQALIDYIDSFTCSKIKRYLLGNGSLSERIATWHMLPSEVKSTVFKSMFTTKKKTLVCKYE